LQRNKGVGGFLRLDWEGLETPLLLSELTRKTTAEAKAVRQKGDGGITTSALTRVFRTASEYTELS